MYTKPEPKVFAQPGGQNSEVQALTECKAQGVDCLSASPLGHTALQILQVFWCEQLYGPAAGTKRYSYPGMCYYKPANHGNRI